MDRETVDLLLDVIDAHGVKHLDLTGGAPELNPHFRYLAAAARRRGVRVTDRCNLSILLEPGQEDLADFLAAEGVDVTASLPCILRHVMPARKAFYFPSIEACSASTSGRKGQLRLTCVQPRGPSCAPNHAGHDYNGRCASFRDLIRRI